MERRLRAADVPVLYADPGIRWAVPLGALIREWEWWPSERVAIIADEPVGASPDNLCRIAAVVHALCDRDGVPVPDWVWQHRWPEPIAWTSELSTEGASWDRTVAQAPAACAWHNVWFREDFISDPKTQAEARRYAHGEHAPRDAEAWPPTRPKRNVAASQVSRLSPVEVRRPS